MQQHHTLTSAIAEGLTGFELDAGRLVETREVAHRQFAGCLGFAEVEHVLDQHAKRSAPIADVILFGDPVPNKGEHAHDGVADDRGA